MEKKIDITPPIWTQPPNPLQGQQNLIAELTELVKENQRAMQSLRPLLLALADIAPDTPALVRAYRVRLAEHERLTGHAPQRLLNIE